MSIQEETREGIRLLTGLENGTLSSADAYNIAERRDPVLVYFVLRYLREKYPLGESSGVARRLIELTSTYDQLVKMSKTGEKDILREWFDESYNMRQFFDQSSQFVELIVEKIEG